MSDTVFLKGVEFYAYHGVNPEERALGQRFVIDVELEADLSDASQTDDIAMTVSYSGMYKRVKTIVEGPSRQLIETVGEDIASALLAEYPLATAATVSVHKPSAPISGAVFNTVGVCLRRSRENSIL